METQDSEIYSILAAVVAHRDQLLLFLFFYDIFGLSGIHLPMFFTLFFLVEIVISEDVK